MEFQEVLACIRRERRNFSAAQKLVADYVSENYYQIPFLSITTLAKNIGVSDNTVVKFCNHLGYDKFAEFKRVFAKYAHSELTMYNKLSDDGVEFESDDNICAKEMEESIANIRTVLNDPTNRENLTKLIVMIEKAKHIYITGGRASGTMAQYFANTLRYLGIKVYDVTFGVGDYLDRLSMVEPEDLVIAISFPRYTAQVVDAIQDLHKAKVPIVLITDTTLCPAHPYSDLVFHCPVSSSNYFISYTGCVSLIEAICRAASQSRKSQASSHVRQLESRLLERGIFL